MTLAHLLLPAVWVQDDAFHHQRIFEVRDGRIVDGDVSILADPHKSQIDRTGGEQSRVARYFRVQVGGVAIEILHATRANYFFHAGSDPFPKARRMVAGNTHVLIHVKDVHALPVDALLPNQGADQGQLRVPCGNHDSRAARLRDGVMNQPGCLLRGSRSQRLLGGMDLNTSPSVHAGSDGFRQTHTLSCTLPLITSLGPDGCPSARWNGSKLE